MCHKRFKGPVTVIWWKLEVGNEDLADQCLILALPSNYWLHLLVCQGSSPTTWSKSHSSIYFIYINSKIIKTIVTSRQFIMLATDIIKIHLPYNNTSAFEPLAKVDGRKSLLTGKKHQLKQARQGVAIWVGVMGGQWEEPGGYKYAHPCSLPLTEGNSGTECGTPSLGS